MSLVGYLYFIVYVLALFARALQWMFSPPYYLGIIPIIIIGAGAVWILLHPDETRKQWDKLVRDAEEGDAASMLMLCYAYEHGNGFVVRDKQKAAAWARKAADAGNATAMNKLGYMYTQGDGVERDFREALLWFIAAMENGNAAAFCNAGYLHWRGLGVSTDKELAARYFLNSAKLGSDSGMLALGCLYAIGDHVEQDKEQAIDWIRKAAQAGNKVAARSLKRICGEEITVKPKPSMKMPGDNNGLDYSTLFLIAGGVGALIVIGAMITLMVSDVNTILESFLSRLMSQPIVRESMENTTIKNIPSRLNDIWQCLFLAFLFFVSFTFTWEGIGGLYGKEFWIIKSSDGDTETSRISMQGHIYRIAFLINFVVVWRFFRVWYGLEDAFMLPGFLFCIGYTIVVIFLIACMNTLTERAGIAQDDEERRERITIWLYVGCLALVTVFLLVFGAA